MRVNSRVVPPALDQLGQVADQHQRPSLAGLGVLGSEPHSADLAVDVLPAQRCDLALAHAGDVAEAREVLQPVGQHRDDGLDLRPGREALAGVLLLQHGHLDLNGQLALVMGEP
jgi:hypothetical protein